MVSWGGARISLSRGSVLSREYFPSSLQCSQVFKSGLKHSSSPRLSRLSLLTSMLPGHSASEVTTLWRYTNLFIIIIIIITRHGCSWLAGVSGECRWRVQCIRVETLDQQLRDVTQELEQERRHTETRSDFTLPFTQQYRLTALRPGLPGWAGTRKVKLIWILLTQETVSGSGISSAICKSAPHSRQITTPAFHHSVFLQAACPSCRPTNSVKALPSLNSSSGNYW